MKPRNWSSLVSAAILSVSLSGNAIADGTITQSTTAPTGFILSQTSAQANPGYEVGTRTGPAGGQTFTATSSFSLASFTVKGSGSAGNAADSNWYDDVRPNGDKNWHVQIGIVNPNTGAITALDTETPTAVGLSDATAYLTFKLGAPVTLTAGNLYSFSFYEAGGYWNPAVADSNAAYGGGQSFHNSTSAGTYDDSLPGGFYGYVSPSGIGDFVFYLNPAVPEPSSVAMVTIFLLMGTLVYARRFRFAKRTTAS